MEMRQTIPLSPALYPLLFDEDRGEIGFIRLDEHAYAAASFLDQRLLQDMSIEVRAPWRDVEAAAAQLRENYHFIFHIGHVGSTLISRLLGQHSQICALREPDILRHLARRYADCALEGKVEDATLGHQTELFFRLWSRTWRPEQTALIKATSFVSVMAYALMARAPQSTRAIFIYATPLTYLRTILASPASRTEVQTMAPQRLRRLIQRFKLPPLALADLGEGEVIAMSWLCEMASLRDAARFNPAAVLWLDFDQFLGHPQALLPKLLDHFAVSTDAEVVQQILNSPTRHRYSKDASYSYDAEHRAQVMIEAERDHGAQIQSGMTWLSNFVGRHPLARRTIDLVAAHHKAM